MLYLTKIGEVFVMKKVYEYIKKHNPVDANSIAVALNITGTDALSIIEQLRVSGYVKMISPIPLSLESNGSCYYTITEKEFPEN